MIQKFNYLVIGSGLAGLYTAYKASFHGSVALITKSSIRESNSYNAQGGIAAVTSIEDDPHIHKMDTVIAGRGLCEDLAVDVLVNEGPKRIKELISEGMRFDTENGVLALGLEGGHHRRRILHAGGDSTGRMITEFLISRVETRKQITVFENMTVLDLLVRENVCYGVKYWNESDCNIEKGENFIFADSVFLTTGGTSAIYSRTTNPQTTVGDGIAIAYKAGCRILDMEFIQFHPSGLYIKDSPKAFLISEAVRGEGAHLLNAAGKRFMLSIHELAELAPRDIVARSIYKQMLADNRPYVILSLKHINPSKLKLRFPNIYMRCKEYGYDFTQAIPVAPAAHYTVGGVASNLYGRTDIDRLYVCGEIASTGIMGANRLASNSLLECLVFADRAIDDSLTRKADNNIPKFEKEYIKDEAMCLVYESIKKEVANVMNFYAGIIRNGELLLHGLELINKMEKDLISKKKVEGDKKEFYLEAAMRLLTVAKLIIEPAIMRKESRGGHYREDYGNMSDEYAVHSVQHIGKEIATAPINGSCLNF
ncbi:MAG: L-aspartate oxidase [Bacteroidales bacterium]